MLPFKPNKKYTLIALYSAAVCAIAITVALLVFHMSAVRAAVAPFFSALSPLLIGAIFAYLMRPLVNRIDRLLHRPIKRAALSRFFSILLTYLIVGTALFLFIFFLVPALLGDTSALGEKMVTLFNDAENLVARLFEIMHISNDSLGGISETLSRYYDEIITAIVSLVRGILRGTYKALLGLFLAGGILFHKETLLCAARRITVALFPRRFVLFIQRVMKHADHTFGKYLVGKIAEALIIGTIYVIVLPLIGMPYPFLVAIIMVITNFIPMVGAYIGGIPCGILILTENPVMVLWFVIICLGIEQIDGNIVIPRVIGSILGLRAVWVIVSVAVFGGLFGIWGMFLSSPIFSVLYVIVRDFANDRLKKKDKTTDTSTYEDLFASQAAPRRRSLRAAWHVHHPPRPKQNDNQS